MMKFLLQFLVVFELFAVQPSAKVLPSDPEKENEVDPIRYLEQFGYIAKQNSRPDESSASPVPLVAALRSSGELRAAVRRFQNMANLPVTGELDEPTKAMMKRPRCGASDVPRTPAYTPIPLSNSNRSNIPRQEYSATDKWQKTKLTYRVDGPPKSPRLLSGVDSELARAFDLWSAVCPLSFVRTEEQPDISISFARGDHGDVSPFDGPGKTLAHAFPPGAELAGDIHFDEEEDWTIGSVEGINLYTVAAHELGHALGVNHSNVQGSLMFPWYQGYVSNLQLHADDINAIQALYGKRNERRQQKPDSCSTDFDSITSIRGEIFLFKDKWFWRRYRNWTIKEPPELISRFWTELPPEVDSIDVAYEAPQNNRIIFVKGKRFYEFEGRRSLGRRDGRPLTDLGLSLEVSRIDSIFTWNERTHLTSGRRHWILKDQTISSNPRRNRLSTVPDSTAASSSPYSRFPRLPIRSAFAHPDGGVYVFGDSYYWMLTDADDGGAADAGDSTSRMMTADEDGRLTSRLWMDCSSRSHGIHPSSHLGVPIAIMAAAFVTKRIL